MVKVRGRKAKALPWALRHTHKNQEEAVSVYACMSVFVSKTKGRKKRRNCMCALMHICESVRMQVYLFMYCTFICIYICGCMGRHMCAERDFCRQRAVTEKCTGT